VISSILAPGAGRQAGWPETRSFERRLNFRFIWVSLNRPVFDVTNGSRNGIASIQGVRANLLDITISLILMIFSICHVLALHML
jgi:hypothetical protein